MAKASPKRTVQCYFCGRSFEVSTKTMSTPCPSCNKALKVEDVVVKSYVPVNDLQTCGKITITPKGRVAAKRIQSGEGIECNGVLEGSIQTPTQVTLGPKSSWKGTLLCSGSLVIEDGAKLNGSVKVPWVHEGNNAAKA
jgi:DNA-directed RNA polymerase subunit RPC12/RpoP